jgi:uncharacterized protein
VEKTGNSKIGGVLAGAAALLAGGLAVWFLVPTGPKLVLKEAPEVTTPPTITEMQKAAREEAKANAEHMRPLSGSPNITPALESEDQRLKTAQVENYRRLEWRILRGLDVKTGDLTPQVKALEGGSIKIPGFMVPFDDDEEKVSQFLLVPQAGMCIHTPAPPANQLILVEMSGEAKLVDWNRQIMVYGTLEIAQSNSPYGPVAYKVNATVARAE